MSHPFGDLLRQYRARKAGLSQTRLAELAGYDQAVLTRMNQGKKDLTGPSGRERVVRLITVLRDEGAIATLDEANALLKAGMMPALFEGQPAELGLIRALKAAGGSATQPPPGIPAQTAPGRHRTNLPAQLTSFVGREREVADLTRLLPETRLLTLTGSGGVGKTRLAQHMATRLLDAFSAGVWIAELASISSGGLVTDTVAATLGLRPTD
jgi:Helix-turn-helix domain